METVLIVDDERNIVELIELYAAQYGFATQRAHDGETALRMFETESPQPDVIVLDLMLPKISGWDVCKRIRQTSDVPILMLTARTDDVDKIVGLELGADDYLTKPFNPRELFARIRAILRRTSPSARSLSSPTSPASAASTIALNGLTLNPDSREVQVKDTPVKLRAKEFDLLHTLLTNRGIVLTRDKLLEIVWGFDFAGETRTVDVHVAQLRKHIAGSGVEIETVFGVGYKLVA
jgi:two-component system, OmpR family, alkaline phosphatase synthesis response regulator PhoP